MATAPNPASADPIKHVVVLMLENRSFDHMLGSLGAELGCEGIDHSRFNLDSTGKQYFQTPGASRTMRFDPHHELEHVLQQLANHNSGFVDDFERCYPRSMDADRQEIMSYHAAGALPALHALARAYTVCDHWFASLPGPTWPNRFFVHSGTSLGRVSMPNGVMDANLHWYDQPTLYDRLNEKRRSWRIYYGDIPQSLVLVHQMEPPNAARYFKMSRFYEDAAGAETDFPEFAFIEPSYYPPGANDDHPPHDVIEGDRLIASVYNALRANEELFNSLMLVILCDEHGGIYDHVEPPKTIPPDHHQEEYTFDRLGVRVPAVIVSPYAAKRVESTVFDHTSLLRYLIGKWTLGPLGARASKANSIGVALLPAPRPSADLLSEVAAPGTIGTPPVPTMAPSTARPQLSSHQSALFAYSQLVESMGDSGTAPLAGRAQRIVTGFDGQVDVAIERVDDFLRRNGT
jgi:phospholipase C